MLRASFGTIVAIWLLNSIKISVGSIIDTSFTFRDVTTVFPDLREASSLTVYQIFLESPVWT